MPRSQKPRFSSALIPFVMTYVRARGEDPAPIIARHLPQGVAQAGPSSITVSAFRELLEETAERLGDPLLGLHLAQAMPRGAYGVLEFAARSAPTGRAALEQLAQFGALINPAARFWLEPSGRKLLLHHRLPDDPKGVGEQGNLFTVARLLNTGREMMGEALTPERAWFAHEHQGEVPEELRSFLRTSRIDFGCTSNGLAFSTADLERPLKDADPALNEVLREHATALMGQLEPEGLHEQTRRAIRTRLAKGEVTLAMVARSLHMSERTLQRRLAEEGISFATLVDDLRRELARDFLANPELSLKEVAVKLGYQDAAAFGRAFKRWTGQTPASWRERPSA